jgi:hypothetical protein
VDSSGHFQWYPGSSFPGFGVGGGGRPPHPKYTSKMIVQDLKQVLQNQRRRHMLLAQEFEANVKVKRGFGAVGLGRVKDFLKTAGDIGPMGEDVAKFKVK